MGHVRRRCGAELPSASESETQCVSRDTTKALGSRPHFLHSSGDIPVRKNCPGGHGACTPSCNTVFVSHAVVGCRRSHVDSSPRSSRRPKRKRPCHLLQTGFRLQRCMWPGRSNVWRKWKRKFWRPSSVEILKAEVVALEERLAGLKAEVTKAASAPLLVPTNVGDDCPEGPVGCLRGGTRCSLTEQFTAKTSRNAPHGQTTSLPCRLWQNRVSGCSIDNPIQETLELGGPPGVTTHNNVVRRGSVDDGDERRNGSVIVARGVSRWGARGQRISESRRRVLDNDSDVPLLSRGRFSILSTSDNASEVRVKAWWWQQEIAVCTSFGTTHRSIKAKGRPMMPLLCSLGQLAALKAMHPGEKLCAYLDDALGLNTNFGPTSKLMSGTGQGRRNLSCDEMHRIAEAADPNARVWRRTGHQNVGAPKGTTRKHQVLLQAIPTVFDISLRGCFSCTVR